MDDIRKKAEERAANPSRAPVGSSFETDRQREKSAIARQLGELDSSKITKISAMSEKHDSSDKLLNVAAYCRVSTDDIDQAISINLQMDEYRKKIKANSSWRYVGTYVDNGFSGTNTAHRPGFLKLIEDARAGKIDMIITKAVSRFARNLLDCIGYIEELKNVAHNFTLNNETTSLDEFLQNISLQSDVDNIGNDQGKVLLMTVHASKGLEFPIVYVVGLEDGVFPHERSMGNSFEMEEERRLMYVAMTRAKKQLILSYAGLRQRNGQYKVSSKSTFVKDIPKNYFTDSKTEYDTGETLEDIKNKVCSRKNIKQTYSPGNKLKHSIYGQGMVLNCQGEGDNEIVTIVFNDNRYGCKKFYVNKNKFIKI